MSIFRQNMKNNPKNTILPHKSIIFAILLSGLATFSAFAEDIASPNASRTDNTSVSSDIKNVYDTGGGILVDKNLDVTGRIKGYKDLAVTTATVTLITASSGVITNFTATSSTMTNLRVTGQAVVPWMTDWKTNLTFTPDATAFGTISNSDFHYRRVGDTMEVVFYFKAGTVTANTAKIALPSGIQIDTAKIGSSRFNPLGWYNNSSGAGGAGLFTVNIAGVLVYDSTGGAGVVTFTKNNFSDATSGIYNPVDATTWNNNGQLAGRFWIPVQGWTTGN
jgi:hypothetical protein